LGSLGRPATVMLEAAPRAKTTSQDRKEIMTGPLNNRARREAD
jgi:hypothetical protein